ncbi:MAG: AAA family ATPase [Bacteroidetes bacterium]|nr:AAA family ATPase [Bacteroidota bacterium]
MKKSIFLLGFMGSGKTSLGKELAHYLNYPFYDLDSEIENATGLKVKEIFHSEGEEAFRMYEAEQLRKFNSTKEPFVLACGGGTPCFHHNMDWMNQNGWTLFLDVPERILAQRLEGQQEERPLLAGLKGISSSKTWRHLLEKRRPIYLQAASRLASEDINLNEVIHMLNS